MTLRPRLGPIAGLCLLLCACAAPPKPPPADRWAAEVRAFAELREPARVQAFFTGVRALDDWPDADYCNAAHRARMAELLRLNPSSLTGHYLRLLCAAQDDDAQGLAEAADAMAGVAQALMAGHTGRDAGDAIPVRELGEANAIFSSAGFDILAVEAVTFEARLCFRYHLVDQRSGRFEYRYASQLPFLADYFSRLSGEPVPVATASTGIIARLLKNQDQRATLARLRDQLRQGELAPLIAQLSARDARSPLEQVLLARAYLSAGDRAGLAELVDPLAELHDRRFAEASLAIGLVLLTLDPSDAAFGDIQALLDRVAGDVGAERASALWAAQLASAGQSTLLVARWLQLGGDRQFLRQGLQAARRADSSLRIEDEAFARLQAQLGK